MKEKNKLWTESATAVCQKKDHTCILVHILVTPKDTLNQNMSTQRKKREVRLPSRQLKGSDPGYQEDYVRIKIGFAVEHTEHGNMVKLEHFQETDLAFLCRCAQL